MPRDNGTGKRRKSWRRGLDDWHATVVRYVGVGLLVYSVGFDRFHNPALLPAATGMIFYKNVAGGRGE